jgi:di/tricarboxylate transporter
MEASPAFATQQRNSHHFFLVSTVDDSAPLRHEKAWVALMILAGMVTAVTAGILNMLTAAMLAAGLMLLTRCCTPVEARRSVNWQVLVVIGAALGIGRSLEISGAAGMIAEKVIGLARNNPWVVLGAIYAVTTIFAELITNIGSAVLVFPIAMASAETLDVSPMPFVMSLMLAASASFATPIGYQTNLMVYGPGGYKFADYLRIGLPLKLLVMGVAVCLSPLIWPF